MRNDRPEVTGVSYEMGCEPGRLPLGPGLFLLCELHPFGLEEVQVLPEVNRCLSDITQAQGPGGWRGML